MLRQAPCYSGTSILFRKTVNKQEEKYLSGKWSDGVNAQGDMVETAWERGAGHCNPSGQGGPLGGGDPELRTNQKVPSR